MSHYCFVAADHALPELNKTGIIKLKVKDMIAQKRPAGIIPWEEMNPDGIVLFSEDPNAFGKFHVFTPKHLPYETREYIERCYITMVEGNHDEQWRSDLVDYVLEQAEAGPVEVWSIWFGDGKQPITERTLTRAELPTADTAFLSERNYRLTVS
ncbi:hypothetical protein [Paenibacillus sp. NPDC058071]|uniref:hypothetical protein n=1 Tax=Paenibacillus sp. NPDC058071 TaxID=3346326 RepID=UPI0036DD5488